MFTRSRCVMHNIISCLTGWWPRLMVFFFKIMLFNRYNVPITYRVKLRDRFINFSFLLLQSIILNPIIERRSVGRIIIYYSTIILYGRMLLHPGSTIARISYVRRSVCCPRVNERFCRCVGRWGARAHCTCVYGVMRIPCYKNGGDYIHFQWYVSISL